jgi:hypothetical protein
MVSSDRRQWQVRSKVALVGFAVSPDDPELIVAATEQGLARSSDAGKNWVQRGKLNGQPEAFLVHTANLYVAVAQLGIVSSADQGRTWRVLYRPALPTG